MRGEEYRAGVIASTVVNMLKNPKKNGVTWLDFFPDPQPPRAQTWDTLLQTVVEVNALLGGDDLRK